VLALASRQAPQPGPGLEQMCSRLVDMIAAGIDDVDAAEKLGALAALRDPGCSGGLSLAGVSGWV